MAVGDFQRLMQRDVGTLHEDDVLIGKMKNHIGNLLEIPQSTGGLIATLDAFTFERCRRHAHHQRPGLLGQVRQKRRGSRAGAAPHPGNDKDQVSAPDNLGQLIVVGLDGGPGQRRVPPGAQAARDRLAKQERPRLVAAGEASVVGVQ